MSSTNSLKCLFSLLITALFIVFSSCTSSTEKQQEKSEPSEKVVQISEEEEPKADSRNKIIFFGNSLTAGYGLDPEEAFPALIQNKIDSLGLPYECVNAGLSGETTAGGAQRVGWILENYTVHIFVLELGGNDGLRGIDPSSSKINLQQIIDTVKGKFPQAQVILAGMLAPPNMGEQYTQSFARIYPELALKNQLPFVPFLLEGVAGDATLNQADGIHPTSEGHEILAMNVWKILEPMITL